jgi:hypothetical protein
MDPTKSNTELFDMASHHFFLAQYTSTTVRATSSDVLASLIYTCSHYFEMARSLASFKIQIVNDVWVSPYVYCIRTNTLSSLVRLPVRLIRAKL